MFTKLANFTFGKDFTNILFNPGRALRSYIGCSRRVYNAHLHYKFDHNPKAFDRQFYNQQSINNTTITNVERNQGFQKGWSISSWALATLGCIVAYLLSNNKAQADDAADNKESESLTTAERRIVTKENFQEIIEKLEKDSPLVYALEFRFTLTSERLQELCSAIQDNTELGYITWHEDQFLTDKILQQIEAKLIVNNKNYRCHPTDYVHGLLSMHAYNNSEPGNCVNLDLNFGFDNTSLKNWRVDCVFDDIPKTFYYDNQKSGYYGVIYVNDKTHQVVLAIRGAEGGIMSLMTDLCKNNSATKMNLEEVLGGQIVMGQQAWNYLATEEAIRIAKEKGYRLSFTGHSLGAWLAELSAFYSHAFFSYPNTKAVTFDSPGSLPMMEKLLPNIKNKNTVSLEDIQIVTYLARPTPVNCCNKHLGVIYKVELPKEVTTWAAGSINNALDKVPGFLKSHDLPRVLMTFDPKTGKSTKYKVMLDWPVMEYTGEGKNFSAAASARVNMILKEKIHNRFFPKKEENNISDAEKIMSDAANKGLDFVIDPLTNYLVGDKTIMTIVGFLMNLNKVDKKQISAYYKYINLEKGEEERKILDFDERFALITLGKYRPGDGSYTMQIIKGNVDDYLYDLYHNKEALQKQQDLPEIVKVQLQDLLSCFTISQVGDGKNRLVPNVGHDQEEIRQRMERLRCVIPRNILDMVQSSSIVIKKTVIKVGENIEIADTRVTKVAEHLPLEVHNYVEMEGKRKELESNLKTKNIAVISGPGGMGKTTLASKYGKDCKQEGWQVRWVVGTNIDEEFLKLARDLKIPVANLSPEDIRDLVYGRLERLSKKQILLIFDSVEDEAKIKKYLMNLPNHVKVVITSRRDRLLEGIGIKSIIVKGFSKEQAVFYMQEALGKDEREARLLVETVDESPFRLGKVVAYLKRHSLMSISKFIEDYEAIKAGRHQDDEIYPEVELLFRDLKGKTPESWRLLKYLAYLDAEGVPLMLVNNLMGGTSAELQEYVNALEELSLMNVLVEGDKRTLKVSHRIVLAEAKKALIEEDAAQPQEILKRLINELDKVFLKKKFSPKDLMDVTQWLSHIKILIREAERMGLPFVDRKELISKLGNYYYAMGINYNEILHCWNQLLSYYRSTHEENHPDVVSALNNIGIAYLELRTEEGIRNGIRHLEESLERSQKLFPGNTPQVAMSLNNLAVAYQKLGGEESAKRGFSFSLDAVEMYMLIDPAGPQTAMAFENLGNACERLGGKENILQGLVYRELALKRRQKIFAGSHPEVAKSLHNIGMAYFNLGDEANIREGIRYIKEGLEMNRELFLNNHPYVSVTLLNLSAAYLGLGGEENIREGLKCADEALKICIKLSPDNRGNEAMLLNNLAVACIALGEQEKIREGLRYSRDAFELCKDIFPYKHSVVASSLNSMGVAKRELGGKENIREGLNHLNESLKRQPDNSPMLARVLYNIGLAHMALEEKENVQEALKSFQSSLEACKKMSFAENQQTALTLNSMSVAYRELGGEDNIQDGLKCAKEALTMLQRLFPSNHPNVAMVLDNLGTYYRVLGDVNLALELKKQAYSIYLATFREDYQKTVAIKSEIESLQPNFFANQRFRENLQGQDCLGGNRIGFECRWPIFFREARDDGSIALTQRIQKTVLSEVVRIVDSNGWSYTLPWADYGVKGYLEQAYLKQELRELGNDYENIETAQMLCFRAMNAGIMKSVKKPYAVVKEFTRANPELVKKIAVRHPEFFVDGSIVEACIGAMQGDEAFEEHMLKHVQYMGMKERREKFSKTASGF